MRDHGLNMIEYDELSGKKNAQSSKTRRVNHPQSVKKEAQKASVGNGRRPHPRFLSNRFRFCPAAIRKASLLTRQRSRKRKRRKPCQSLASANSGSTHTLRLRRALW